MKGSSLLGALESRVAASVRVRCERRLPEQQRRAREWIRSGNDHTLRLDYDDVGPDDIVLDLGGYQGQWASDIFGRYCCRIHVFEPVPDFATTILQRFAKNPHITVNDFGLASATGIARLRLAADSTSAFAVGRASTHETVEIKLIEAKTWFDEAELGEVALMKINIEGGEFDLLEHLLAEDLARRVRNIQVQFHDCIPNAEARMRVIQDRLDLTHAITYQSMFVWENWRRRA